MTVYLPVFSASQLVPTLPLSQLKESWARALIFFHAVDDHVTVNTPAPSTDDLAMVKATLCGDADAYARIIQKYQQTLARRMLRFTRDPLAVEEMVHDCFVEAYSSLSKYRGDAPLEHWLQRIATRVGYRYWKRRRVEKDHRLDLQHLRNETAVAVAPALDAAEELSRLLDQLSPRDRLALTLLHVEDRSVAEAAEMCGWSQTMLKVQAYRARKKLRAIIETKGGPS